MTVSLINCSHCGGPLPVVDGQRICRCAYCRNPYFLDHDQPPAVVLASELTADQARIAVLTALRDPRIEPGFRKGTFFERATLFYIPFSEVRGIKAGWAAAALEPTGQDAFSMVSFEYLEPANDLSALFLDVLDRSIVEAAMLKARQVPFRPLEMRRRGVVLPATPTPIIKSTNAMPDLRDTIENHLRLVYLPVWEIVYSYRGIMFHSYCSAVDGTMILVNGLRNHRRKLSLSLLGSFSLALLLGRTIRVAVEMVGRIRSGIFFLLTAGILVAGAALTWAVLFPYLWRLFAFREEISISGNFTSTRTISYREGALLKFSRRFVNSLTGESGESKEP
ncbi:MAG TPA: hypothetical protein ENN40_02435 [Candidatus Aminicenantes bacterium]|nr:hypothetical protein [Candidatus Aminicenantes bacterium]